MINHGLTVASLIHHSRLNLRLHFFVVSLLPQRVIFACLPDFYLFKRADFKAMAFRHLADIFKQAASIHDVAKTFAGAKRFMNPVTSSNCPT